jgi:ABC-type glycerol-3-phosphate transport system permease component
MRKYVCDGLAIVVILISCLTFANWWGQWVPNWSMKPEQFVMFVFCAALCMGRSGVSRCKRKDSMLKWLGFSYTITFTLLICQTFILILEGWIFAVKHDAGLLLSRSWSTYFPEIITVACTFLYAVTGLCTRWSYTIATVLLTVGIEGYFLYGYMISPSSAVCFVLLGVALYIARFTGPPHWFLDECRTLV